MGSTSWPEKLLLGIFYFLEIQFCKMLERYGECSQILVYAVTTFFMSIIHVISVTAFLPTIVNKLNKKYFENAGMEAGEARANILGCFSTLHLEMKRRFPGAYRTDESVTLIGTEFDWRFCRVRAAFYDLMQLQEDKTNINEINTFYHQHYNCNTFKVNIWQ